MSSLYPTILFLTIEVLILSKVEFNKIKLKIPHVLPYPRWELLLYSTSAVPKQFTTKLLYSKLFTKEFLYSTSALPNQFSNQLLYSTSAVPTQFTNQLLYSTSPVPTQFTNQLLYSTSAVSNQFNSKPCTVLLLYLNNLQLSSVISAVLQFTVSRIHFNDIGVNNPYIIT